MLVHGNPKGEEKSRIGNVYKVKVLHNLSQPSVPKDEEWLEQEGGSGRDASLIESRAAFAASKKMSVPDFIERATRSDELCEEFKKFCAR